MIELDKIYNEDCLEGMKRIPDGSVDAIICDLPYGTTECVWDSIIPFDKLWVQYRRIVKTRGAICLFGSEPFSTKLRMSNLKEFRYDWIWDKERGGNFPLAKFQPMKSHEIISVFGIESPNYYPQMDKGKPYKVKGRARRCEMLGRSPASNYCAPADNDGDRFPLSIQTFSRDSDSFHPTQKPVDLLRYLIRTYSNEGDTILDNCMGSGTTAVACIKEKRHFIGFELNQEYFDKACKRIDAERRQLTLF